MELHHHALHMRWAAMAAKCPRSIHRARIALRRSTHLLNAMSDHVRPVRKRTMTGLKRTQAQLGRLHDTQVLVDRTTATLPKLLQDQRSAVAAFLDRYMHLLDHRVAGFLRNHRPPRI